MCHFFMLLANILKEKRKGVVAATPMTVLSTRIEVGSQKRKPGKKRMLLVPKVDEELSGGYGM